MKHTIHMIFRGLLIAGMLLLPACVDDDSKDNGSAGPSMVGTWVVCYNEGTGDDGEEILTFTASDITIVLHAWSSTVASCTGTKTPGTPELLPYTTGGPVSAALGAATVTAYVFDVVDGAQTLYGIYYIDEASTPNVLYLGDETADLNLDGSTPDKRPTALQDWKPRPKQP